jgi:predicted nuclease of predicted toxin-antitoxin system
VKLLFDENLSRRLVTRVADAFPDCSRVTAIGRAVDRQVWEYAGRHDYVLVSKDWTSTTSPSFMGRHPR